MEKWSEQKAADWAKKAGWLRGFNYRPADCRDSFEIFQEYGFEQHLPIIESEMSLAAETGFNTMRLAGSFPCWRDQHDGYMQRLETVLSIAWKHGISVLFVFANDCSAPKSIYKAPVFGEQRTDWGFHGGKSNTVHKVYDECGYNPAVDEPDQYPLMLEMIREVIGKYAHDERIIAWDLLNEPGNGRRDSKSLNAMIEMFAVAREVGPDQPLTSGAWTYKNDNGRIVPGNSCEEIQLKALELSDIITFHDYGNYENDVKLVKHLKATYRRPVLNTEWLNRIQNNNIAELYPYYMSEFVGCYCWGLVAGKSQTYEPWESLWVRYDRGTLPADYDMSKWMHDLFRINHRPYDPREIALIKRINAFADDYYGGKFARNKPENK